MAKNTNTTDTAPQPHKQEDFVNIDFVKAIGIWALISGGLTLASIILIFTKGLNYGIDFSGGSEVQVRFAHPVKAEEVRAFTDEQGFKNAVVQQFGSGESSEYLIRLEAKEGATDKETNENLQVTLNKARAAITAKWTDAEIRRVDTVGPQIGNQLKRNGI